MQILSGALADLASIGVHAALGTPAQRAFLHVGHLFQVSYLDRRPSRFAFGSLGNL